MKPLLKPKKLQATKKEKTLKNQNYKHYFNCLLSKKKFNPKYKLNLRPSYK